MCASIVLTGSGRAFSAGTDLVELAGSGDFRGDSADPTRFERLVDALVDLPKPLVCAVNGLGVGIGATLFGHADLVVMAETARLRCPFTSLALVPEAAASVTFPFLLGRQAAAWVLLSSEWVDAAEAKSMGLALEGGPRRRAPCRGAGAGAATRDAAARVARRVEAAPVGHVRGGDLGRTRPGERRVRCPVGVARAPGGHGLVRIQSRPARTTRSNDSNGRDLMVEFPLSIREQTAALVVCDVF